MIPGIYKQTTIDRLIREKDSRESLKGWAMAETDFDAVCLQFKNDFSKLYEYMQTRYIADGEQTLKQLLVSSKKEEEERIIGQIKRMRYLHRQFMKYAKNLQN